MNATDGREASEADAVAVALERLGAGLRRLKGIACGLLGGLREGLLDASFDEPVARARGAILARIGDDGLLADVSDGTSMGPDLDFYRRIPNLPRPTVRRLRACS